MKLPRWLCHYRRKRDLKGRKPNWYGMKPKYQILHAKPLAMALIAAGTRKPI